jgi:hypothetical protein
VTGQLLLVPGLGGTTSSKILVGRTGSQSSVFMSHASMSIATSVDVAIGRAREALRGGARDRLAELREAAARRARTMPMYDDPIEEVAERTSLVEAFEELQAETNAWKSED